MALRSSDVVEKSLRLQGASHPATRQAVADLVRSMNSYYSNLIEGQSTHPKNIDRALAQDFSEKPDTARRQRIAVAHISAERELEAEGVAKEEVLRGAYLRKAHETFFGHLAQADRMVEDRVVVPGALREADVKVFRHHPPTWSSVPRFLERADQSWPDFKVGPKSRLYLQGALRGMTAALRRLRETRRLGEDSSLVASFEERRRLVKKDSFDALAAKSRA